MTSGESPKRLRRSLPLAGSGDAGSSEVANVFQSSTPAAVARFSFSCLPPATTAPPTTTAAPPCATLPAVPASRQSA